jgi:tRNA-specific 2-thiouridylase
VKVLVALSGGVDSSVAAAELLAAGHEVVGITMRLWGGDSDTGCCSIADVDDARRVAQQLGIDHLVFNFAGDFEQHVVTPYVDAHRVGLTPNPCIECNRHIKFHRLSERADLLGFDAVATGHHATIVERDGKRWVGRGHDAAKDQSYVVHMLTAADLARTLFPIGAMTKAEVRERASALGLRTAAKPDSQDVCFITDHGGRGAFLGERIAFRPAQVVDSEGSVVGEVPAVEMVTLGQRRGLHLPGGGPKQYVVHIDPAATVATSTTVTHGPTVVVGDEALLQREAMTVGDVVWANDPPRDGAVVRVQCSAHGATAAATLTADDLDGTSCEVQWHATQRKVAPGQSVVFYDPTDVFVLGGGIAV